MKYRSRPTECEAMWWESNATTPQEFKARAERIVAWVNANGGEARYEHEQEMLQAAISEDVRVIPARIAVRTINGLAYAAPGHYVVMGSATFHMDSPTGPNGLISLEPEHCRQVRDFYPCDPETFERRWEPVQ